MKRLTTTHKVIIFGIIWCFVAAAYVTYYIAPKVNEIERKVFAPDTVIIIHDTIKH